MAAETRDMPSEGQQMSLPRAASRAHGVCRLDAECFKPGEKAELLPDSPVSHLRCPDFINLHDIESSSADELTSSGSGELPAVEAADDDGLHETVQEVDARDLKTPDDWVCRHPALIRLTGRHPFNCEPPLPTLMERGFITPVSLHYVRNHGAVPRLGWDHRFSVGGLVERPQDFSVSDLIKALPTFTLPVTLVCAGNRRREQNIVKKSKGFNWGPSAVSTTHWTGVRLCDLLRYCGVRRPSQGAKHVLFAGVEKELPQGKDGTYGTSLRYGVAMDPGCDVMVCFMQNGRLLQPDHGFPVRMIIPGHIGGRMVKWLNTITVCPEESDNFYHFHDNRVLPPNVDQERAKNEGWWFRPEFIINELNINSAITTPAHDEVLTLGNSQDYTIQGYAYTGGGRMIIRCEVTLDLGKTWRLATIAREEEPTVYGKYWCWVRWSLSVPTVDILRAPELRCRAVDSSNNSQPEGLVWNVMGMMNNPHFRVFIHATATPQGLAMRFEHPTKSGGEGGGWMEREMGHVSNSLPSESDTGGNIKMALDEAALPTYTMEEVEKHDSRESAWFVHNGRIIDGTKFLNDHPGGAESIVMDATDEFEAIHSSKAKNQLMDFVIGKLGESNSEAPTQQLQAQSDKAADKAREETTDGRKTALNPKKKLAFPLTERVQLSHNVFLFRFGLPSEEHSLGLPVGQHVFIYGKDKGEMVMRAYTPTSTEADKGHFDLVVKVYWANEHPSFPQGGRMSQYLEKLKVGETADFKGPLGHFIYTGPGAYTKSGKPGKVARLSMIAGGTGITPMYQIMQAILMNKEDTTRVRLVFANTQEHDILLRDELVECAKDERCDVHFILSKPPDGWTGGKGRCCQATFEEHLFPAADDCLALICGPPAMQDKCAQPILDKMGYKPDKVVVF